MISASNFYKGIRELWQFDNRFQLIINRILFRHDGLLAYKLKNLSILVDHHGGDASGTRYCIASNMYRQFLNLLPCDREVTVLDLGANGGGFPLMLLAEGFRFRQLACVEMNPQTYSRLQFNIARNVPSDYRLFNVAVCGNRRNFDLPLGMGSPGDSIYSAANASGRLRTVRIEGLTFNDIIKTSFPKDQIVDICKMDIEGAEYEVFSGVDHSEIQRVKFLIIEIHDSEAHDKSNFISNLEKLGFVMAKTGATGESVFLFANSLLHKV